MKLILELSNEIVKPLNAGLYSESYDRLTNVLKANAVSVREDESPLSKFLIVDINSKDQGNLILEELKRYNIILSGYIKPSDESPHY